MATTSHKLTKQNPKMKQDFFKFLSPEIIINILSRVPVRTTKSCKCVCKSWLGLIETREFVKSYISKSARSLAIVDGKTSYKMVEFVDDTQNSGHHFHVVLDFKLPRHEPVHSSVNGLLFLFNYKEKAPRDLVICNPITGEYVELPPPTETSSPDLEIEHDTFGFGVSKISGQYKIVRIFHENSKFGGIAQTQPMCEVYTLGTKSWRSITSGSQLECREYGACASFNGNLYWLVYDPMDKPEIYCLDLETELFITPFYPPFHRRSSAYWLSVLGDRLCFSDNAAMGEIVIWLMKKRKYGGENSWSRAYIIKRPFETFHFGDFPVIGYFFPIKVFRDGDILFGQGWSMELYSYSKKTKTLRKCEPSEAWGDHCGNVVIYTPSFLSLETFGMENVSSFSDV